MTVLNMYNRYRAMAIPLALVATILVVVIIAFIYKDTTNDAVLTPMRYGTPVRSVTLPTGATAPAPARLSDATKDQLLYLIEEEKLAHDVYLKMYELYGARVFANILKSETNHQSRVLTLLAARDIPDPRSSKVGEFTNKDLQALYDRLVAQGSQSLSQAYAVGVAIEELDIADIQKDLQALDAAQTDIKSTLEALLRGSKNHLQAFGRQVG